MTIPSGTGRVIALAVGQFSTTLAAGLAAYIEHPDKLSGLAVVVAIAAATGSAGQNVYAHFQMPPGKEPNG